MKKTSKHNASIKSWAEKNGLGITTVKNIDKHRSEGKAVLLDLTEKAKANSKKRIYAQDLIVPNNAMLLQLLKHNWQRYPETPRGDFNYRYIELKRDWYREKLTVLSSGIYGNDNGKVFFSGLTVKDFYLISGIYTAMQSGRVTEKKLGDRPGIYTEIACKHVFKILNPAIRWDKTTDETKKQFKADILALFTKTNTIQADYYLNRKRAINSIEPQNKDDVENQPTDDSVGLIFKRAMIDIKNEKIYIQVNQNGLLNQAAEQNRLVTICKDWLTYGRNTSNHDLIKFYISYRIELAANSHNKMKSEINIKNMQWQIGKTDKAYIRKYMQNLKDMHILKDFELTRLKITWTIQSDKDIDIIQVRDENKELVEKEKTQEIIELEKRLAQINAFTAKHKITLENKVLNTRLHAVFSRNSYEMGGRLYTDGDNGYQGITAADRANIRIDGQKTVELDFSAYHAHLLYNLRGLNTAEDPYNFHPSRKAAKLAFNIALNAKNRDSAIGAFKRAWTDNGGTTPEKDLFTSAERLFDLCRAKHETIADSFCNDRGLTLQNIDSKIALRIVEDLQKKRIVCLPMHDSFIVKAEYKDVLTETMQKVYRQYTGFDCPIK